MSTTNRLDFQPESLRLSAPIPLTQHPAAVYLANLSTGSRPTMRQSLDKIADILTNGECDVMTLDWSKLRYRHTSAIRAALRSTLAASTTNKMMCAMRRVLKEALRLDLIPPEDYAKAVDVSHLPESRVPKGRALEQQEISILMTSCAGSRAADIRDRALIAILRGTGIRRKELVNLDLKDFKPDTGALSIRQGKGAKDRIVFLPEDAIALVNQWIEVRGEAPGALLHPVSKSDVVIARRMTPDAVMKILKRRGRSAGLDPFSPHDFRRTFCSDLLEAGVDIVTVQKLAGHSSPVTTAKYDRRGEDTLRRAVQKLRIH